MPKTVANICFFTGYASAKKLFAKAEVLQGKMQYLIFC
jgi:tellurite resistance-related uncharacterized protein